MALKDWDIVIDDEWTATGGGFDYFITIYRSKQNPLKQIEIWQTSDREHHRKKEFGVNIGTRESVESLSDEFIEGNYDDSQSFKTLKDTLKFIMDYMTNHEGA